MSKNNATKRLAKARKMRARMGAELDAIADGRIYVGDALRSPSPALGRVKIFDVLRRTPKLGREGAKKILQRNHIWPEDRLGQLKLEDRTKIINALPPRVTQTEQDSQRSSL